MKRISSFLLTIAFIAAYSVTAFGQYSTKPKVDFIDIKNDAGSTSNPEAGRVRLRTDGTSLIRKLPNGSSATILDSANSSAIFNAHTAVSVNSTTYSLSASGKGVINLTGTASGKKITAITGATDGQRLTLVFGDGNVSLDSTAFKLLGNVDFLGAANDVLDLVYDGTTWRQTAPAQQVTGLNGPLGGQTPAALAATTGTFSSTLAATGNFAINTDKFTVAGSSGNTVVAGTLAVTGATTFTAGAQSAAVARTATSDGLTTGTIAAGTRYVTVTSASANNIIVLPAPVVGNTITLFVGATGYELRTSDPATIAINGGTGSAAESAIGANTVVYATCVSSTAWIAYQQSSAGTLAATEVAAP